MAIPIKVVSKLPVSVYDVELLTLNGYNELNSACLSLSGTTVLGLCPLLLYSCL